MTLQEPAPIERLPFACPKCDAPLERGKESFTCEACRATYRDFVGLPDFRLQDFDSPNQRALAERFHREWDSLTYEDMIHLRFDGLRERAQQAGKAPSSFAAWNADEQAHLASYADRGAVHREVLDGMISQLTSAAPRKLLADIGCGWGRDLLHLADLAETVVGVDVSSFSLLMAKKLLEEHGVTNVVTILAQGEHLPLQAGSVDAMNSSATIEHFPDPGGFLRDTNRVLRSRGWLFLYYPNRFSVLPETHTLIPFLGWRSRRRQQELVPDWNVHLFSEAGFRQLVRRNFHAYRSRIRGIPLGLEGFMLTSKFRPTSTLKEKLIRGALRVARSDELLESLASFFAPVHFFAAVKQ